jgi:hypothetical protein
MGIYDLSGKFARWFDGLIDDEHAAKAARRAYRTTALQGGGPCRAADCPNAG